MPLKYRSENICQHYSTRLEKPQIDKDQMRKASTLTLYFLPPLPPTLISQGWASGSYTLQINVIFTFFIFLHLFTHLSCDAKLFPPCLLLHILAKDGPCPKLGVIILGIYHLEKWLSSSEFWQVFLAKTFSHPGIIYIEKGIIFHLWLLVQNLLVVFPHHPCLVFEFRQKFRWSKL